MSATNPINRAARRLRKNARRIAAKHPDPKAREAARAVLEDPAKAVTAARKRLGADNTVTAPVESVRQAKRRRHAEAMAKLGFAAKPEAK